MPAVVHLTAARQRLSALDAGTWRMVCGARWHHPDGLPPWTAVSPRPNLPDHALMHLEILAHEGVTCPHCLQVKQIAAEQRSGYAGSRIADRFARATADAVADLHARGLSAHGDDENGEWTEFPPTRR